MESSTSRKQQNNGFNFSFIIKYLRIFLYRKIYHSDIFIYFLYPLTKQLLSTIRSPSTSKQLPRLIDDLKPLANHRGWLFKISQQTTIQQCEASKTIVEETLDIINHGRQRIRQAWESRNNQSIKHGEMYYSHLYATVRYPVYETFTCEIPNATVIDPNGYGLVITPEHEVLAQSTLREIAGLTPTLPVYPDSSSSSQQLLGKYVALLDNSEGNYAHWFMDCLPKLAVVDSSDSEFKVIVNAHSPTYRIDSLKLLGIPEERVVETQSEIIRVERLILCHAAQRTGVPNAIHLRNIRDRLTSAVIGSRYHPSPKRRIYISRARTSRSIVNEKDLMPILREYKFEIVFCEDLNLVEQIHLFSEAQVILGAHGAGIFNQIFCNSGTVVIEIYNRQRWEHAPRKISSILNQKHWYIFGEQADSEWNININSRKFQKKLAYDWNTWVDPRKLQKVLSYALEDSPLKDGPIYDEKY